MTDLLIEIPGTPAPQVRCPDCLVVQPALFDEPYVDGGYLQECVNCMVTIHHETEKL